MHDPLHNDVRHLLVKDHLREMHAEAAAHRAAGGAPHASGLRVLLGRLLITLGDRLVRFGGAVRGEPAHAVCSCCRVEA